MPTLSCSGARAQTESLFFGIAAGGFAVFGRGIPDLFFEYAVEVAHTAEAAAVSDAGHRRAFFELFFRLARHTLAFQTIANRASSQRKQGKKSVSVPLMGQMV